MAISIAKHIEKIRNYFRCDVAIFDCWNAYWALFQTTYNNLSGLQIIVSVVLTTMSWYGYCGDELHKAKQEKIQKLLGEKGLDAILFFDLEAVRYLTDYFTTMGRIYREIPWTSYFAFIARGGPPVVGWSGLSDAYRIETFGAPCDTWGLPAERGRTIIDKWPDSIRDLLRKYGLTKGKIALDFPPFFVYLGLKKLVPDLEFVDGGDFWQELRAVKLPKEIEYIREVEEITDIGMQAALDAIKVGLKEYEVSAEAEYAMRKAGSEMNIAPPLITTIPGSRIATDKRIKHGDTVMLDFGAVYKGYMGDMARTKIVGKPTEKQKEVYRTIYGALQAGIEAIKPGAKCSEIDQAVRQVIRDRGWTKYEYRRVSGHQLGFGVIGEPLIGPGIEAELKTNMVLTIEPNMFVYDAHPAISVALEDAILVTETGHEVLTTTEFDERLLD